MSAPRVGIELYIPTRSFEPGAQRGQFGVVGEDSRFDLRRFHGLQLERETMMARQEYLSR